MEPSEMARATTQPVAPVDEARPHMPLPGVQEKPSMTASTRWLVDLERLQATLTEMSQAEEQFSDELVGLLQQIHNLLQSILSRQSAE
jgi:hypothetical protein